MTWHQALAAAGIVTIIVGPPLFNLLWGVGCALFRRRR